MLGRNPLYSDDASMLFVKLKCFSFARKRNIVQVTKILPSNRTLLLARFDATVELCEARVAMDD